MERIPGFSPRKLAPLERPYVIQGTAPELHYFGCGRHREVLVKGEVATPYCPKCGPGDFTYDNWGEKLRPSWRPSSGVPSYQKAAGTSIP